jgi:hypothetical protein
MTADMNAAESGHITSSNVVRMSQAIAQRRQERPTRAVAEKPSVGQCRGGENVNGGLMCSTTDRST